MSSVEVKWLIDSISDMSSCFEEKLGLKFVINNRDKSSDELIAFRDIVKRCIDTGDDSEYVLYVFKDYEKVFGTRVYIPEPNGSKELLFRIICESYRVDYDYLGLYYRGAALSTLDILSIDLVGNDVNLSGVEMSRLSELWVD